MGGLARIAQILCLLLDTTVISVVIVLSAMSKGLTGGKQKDESCPAKETSLLRGYLDWKS